MKQKIKGYLVFTSLGYRVGVFILMPLALVGIQVLFSGQAGGSGPLVVLLLPLLEIMADNWFLGGIQEKNAENLDYLKTSFKGMKVMRSTLIMDLSRRLMTAVVVFGICFLMNRFLFNMDSQVGADLILPVLMSYSLSVLGTLITRFQSYLWVSMVVGYIAAIIGAIFFILVMFGVMKVLVINIVFAVLAVVFSILAVKIAMARVEGGYYDK